MKLIPATLDDCAHLARMNKQLIVAEGSDNPMDEGALTIRMQGFLCGTYRAWFFVRDDEIIGYTLLGIHWLIWRVFPSMYAIFLLLSRFAAKAMVAVPLHCYAPNSITSHSNSMC